MKRSRKLLLTILILSIPLLTISAEPPTLNEVTSAIKPETLYPGSLVITAIQNLITMYETEMQTATEEAGRTAAATIEAVMQKEKDELAAWYDAELLKIQTELDKEVKKESLAVRI